MWFSPLKGAHLTLGQLDKTLPVDGSVPANKQIERGSFVYISTGGATNGEARFALYTADQAVKPNAVPYIALMGYNDFQAGMAGNIGQAPEVLEPTVDKGTAAAGDALTFLNKTNVEGAQGFTGPRITAISVVQPAEYQTTAFDPDGTYYVGQPLTIANGKLTPFTAGQNIVGYVTAKPKVRWVNDLGASREGARISGGNVKVIEFSTAWIPAAIATVDTTTAPIGALNVGKPQVAPAPAKPVDNKPQGAPAPANPVDNKPQAK